MPPVPYSISLAANTAAPDGYSDSAYCITDMIHSRIAIAYDKRRTQLLTKMETKFGMALDKGEREGRVSRHKAYSKPRPTSMDAHTAPFDILPGLHYNDDIKGKR